MGVNYNMADYLPQKAVSTTGIKVMNQEFTQAIPNVNVMVENVSVMEALSIKKQISTLDSVSEILWLDDVADLKKPLEMQDKILLKAFIREAVLSFLSQ